MLFDRFQTMELLNLPLFQFAIPVVAVIACILLVYAFGFKPTETSPAFTNIIEEDDEDKLKVKKAKNKKIVKPGNNILENHTKPVVSALKPNKQATNVESKKVVKKSGKPVDNKANEVSKNEIVEKEIFVSTDDWTTAISKKGRKNKSKKENGGDDDDVDIKNVVDDNNNVFTKAEKKKTKKAIDSHELVAETSVQLEATTVGPTKPAEPIVVIDNKDPPISPASIPLNVAKGSPDGSEVRKKKSKSSEKNKSTHQGDFSSVDDSKSIDSVKQFDSVNKVEAPVVAATTAFSLTEPDTCVVESVVGNVVTVDNEEVHRGVVVVGDSPDANVLSKSSKKKKKNAENKKNDISLENLANDDTHMLQVKPTISHHDNHHDDPSYHDHSNIKLTTTHEVIHHPQKVEQEHQQPTIVNHSPTTTADDDNSHHDQSPLENSEVWEEAKPIKKKKKVQKI